MADGRPCALCLLVASIPTLVAERTIAAHGKAGLMVVVECGGSVLLGDILDRGLAPVLASLCSRHRGSVNKAMEVADG